MRLLVVTHIGETLGHLIRALSVCSAFARCGDEVHVCTTQEGLGVVRGCREELTPHFIRWEWSHNAWNLRAPQKGLFTRVAESARDVEKVMLAVKPDLVLGFPGMVSVLIARKHLVPHASVLHAPYLFPYWEDDNSPEGVSLGKVGRKVCELATEVARGLHHVMATPALSYEDYLESERMFVPQPGLRLRGLPRGARMVGFIRGSIGDPFTQDMDLTDCCYVSFGSGNPCDLSSVVQSTRKVFSKVLVTVGHGRPVSSGDGVFVFPALASKSLVGKVKYVLSHGGLGTVGTFAESRTRQLIVPTEFDQATTAVYARNLGIARTWGLKDWVTRLELGRRLPPHDASVFEAELSALKQDPMPPAITADGADEIAGLLH